MNAIFDHADHVIPGVRTFWFRPEQPVRYVAGQFTELTILHHPADERGTVREFTLSSSPSDALLGITVKFVPGGSSFKQALLELQPGAIVQLTDPMGDFVLPKDPAIPLVFIAGGIGITPVHSIVKWLTDQHEQRNVRLFHLVRTPEELALADVLVGYPLTFTPLVRGADGRHFAAADVLEQIPDKQNAMIYLSGPEPMVQQFANELKTAGVSDYHIVTDRFTGYTSI